MVPKINWDAFGIATSVACAIHCALLPLFLTSLPLFGVNIINSPGFEYFMIAVACGIGFHALYHGRKKHHHNQLPMALFSVGIVFLLVKTAWHEYTYIFLLPAVAFIVSAHYLNFRLCRDHGRTQKHHCDHS